MSPLVTSPGWCDVGRHHTDPDLLAACGVCATFCADHTDDHDSLHHLLLTEGAA